MSVQTGVEFHTRRNGQLFVIVLLLLLLLIAVVVIITLRPLGCTFCKRKQSSGTSLHDFKPFYTLTKCIGNCLFFPLLALIAIRLETYPPVQPLQQRHLLQLFSPAVKQRMPSSAALAPLIHLDAQDTQRACADSQNTWTAAFRSRRIRHRFSSVEQHTIAQRRFNERNVHD